MAGNNGALVLLKEDGWAGGTVKIPMDREDTTGFGYYERLFYAYNDGAVMDYGDYEARDIYEMFRKDYKARQIENVLVQPITAAEYTIEGIKGDSGEADWLNNFWQLDSWSGGCRTDLDEIIAQACSAISYKRAYFELVFAPDPNGKQVIYRDVAFRPATTCRLRRDPQTSKLLGFEQEPYFMPAGMRKNMFPIVVPKERAFVHIHGMRHDPLWGTSDMEIPYWCWATKQKLLFLWMQFLENVALPRTIVKSSEIGIARQIAASIAAMKNSGVLPVSTGSGPNDATIDTLDVSGKGAEQFQTIVQWLDMAATGSVLANFLDLTGMAAARGVGSFALSKDASDFFLQTREADTRELEKSIRRRLFAPLIRYNFGPKAAVPRLQFEPLNAEDKSLSVGLLQAMVAAKGDPNTVPSEFIAELAGMVGKYLGMDATKIQQQFEQQAAQAAQQAAAAGASSMGAQVAGVAGAVNAATAMVRPAPAGTAAQQANKPPMPAALAELPGNPFGFGS